MKPTHNLFLRSASLATILGLGGMHSAHAAALTWTGATDSNLNTTTNWSPNADPSGDNLIFSNNVNTIIGITSDITIAGVANGISFNAGAGAFTIGAFGTSRKFTFSTITNNGINVASSVTTDQTINANLTFGGDNSTNTFRIQNYGTGLLKLNGTVGSGGANKTLALAGSGNIELTNILGQAASTALTSTSTGIVTLSGPNTYAGKVTVSSGVLVFQKTQANSTATAGTNTVADGATLGLGVGGTGYYGVSNVTDLFNGTLAEFNSISAIANVGIDTTAGDYDYTASAPSTTRGLMKLGANTLTLSGTNAYTGVTTVRSGTLKVNSTGVINNAASSGGTGIVIGGSSLDIDGGTVNFLGGTALAVGDNTTTGNVIVRAGSSFNLTGNIAIGQGSSGVGNTPVSTFTQLGGTTTFGTSSTLYVGNFRGATMDIQGGTLTSASAANIGVRGNSTLSISGENTAVTFTQINLGLPAGSLLPTADLNLNGGTLILGSNGITKAVTDGAKTVSFNGGTLKASAASSDFVNADSVFVKTGGATIDTNTFDVTIDNALLQFEATTGSLTKSGAGTLTLSNTNTYTGPTAITTGTLALGAAGSIASSSSVAIAAGAELETVLQTTYAIPSGKTVTFGLNGAGAGTSGQIQAAGLDISAATVAFDISGTLDDAAYVLATYTSKTGSAFASVTPPSGYQLDYAFNGGTQIALVPSAVSGYSAWASANANNQAANLDFDNDGVDNGVEYFMGQTGSSFTASPTSFTGTTATWTNGGNIPAAQYGTQFVIQTSTDLVDWTPILDNHPDLSNQASSVAFTLTGTGKQFVRLIVTPN